MARADQIDSGLTKDMNPGLNDFIRRGGKLLQFHGWSDPQIPRWISIQYYESVKEFMGESNRLGPSSLPQWPMPGTMKSPAESSTLSGPIKA
jgi:hypothetical protein